MFSYHYDYGYALILNVDLRARIGAWSIIEEGFDIWWVRGLVTATRATLLGQSYHFCLDSQYWFIPTF